MTFNLPALTKLDPSCNILPLGRILLGIQLMTKYKLNQVIKLSRNPISKPIAGISQTLIALGLDARNSYSQEILVAQSQLSFHQYPTFQLYSGRCCFSRMPLIGHLQLSSQS